MPGAVPVAPLTLAAYQDGAVVSRMLLKRGGGTVTLFAFDEGQSLSEHTAPFDAIAYVLEGEALITIAGAPITVPAERWSDAGESAARSPRGVAVQDAADDPPIGVGRRRAPRILRRARREEASGHLATNMISDTREIAFLPIVERAFQELVVVLDDRRQIREAAVMIAALGVRHQRAEQSGPVTPVPRSIRLEVIDLYLRRPCGRSIRVR